VRAVTVRARVEEVSRRLRPLLVLRQLPHRGELAEAGEQYRSLGLRKPWFGLVRHSEVAGRGTGTARLDRDDGIAELRADPRYQALPKATREGLDAWPEEGYLVAKGFFEAERVAAVNEEIDRLTGSGSIREHSRSARFMNAHRKSPAAAGLVEDPRLLELLELILGRRARLFQTISFLRGSQQSAHSDAFHMMTEPPGFLVGVWIALERIDESSGPVFYLPGSHRMPYVMTEDLDLGSTSPLMTADKGRAYVHRMREQESAAPRAKQAFTADPGDVLFWHHNLLHGGSAIEREGATRRSLVAHFFGEHVLCYHEVTERPAVISRAAVG
jgi:ectoine hydroxylase-related dioxygenase (phytanoyl-CoA dioxygenase family)